MVVWDANAVLMTTTMVWTDEGRDGEGWTTTKTIRTTMTTNRLRLHLRGRSSVMNIAHHYHGQREMGSKQNVNACPTRLQQQQQKVLLQQQRRPRLRRQRKPRKKPW